MKKFAVVPRLLGILLLLHALMLLGADEISSIENGGIRTIRSFARILTLYRADPEPLLMALPGWLSVALGGFFRCRAGVSSPQSAPRLRLLFAPATERYRSVLLTKGKRLARYVRWFSRCRLIGRGV